MCFVGHRLLPLEPGTIGQFEELCDDHGGLDIRNIKFR